MLRKKYNYTGPQEHVNYKGINSSSWREINKTKCHFLEPGCWSIRDGKTIDAWMDSWMDTNLHIINSVI